MADSGDMVIIMLGPPGCGKGTQSKLISSKFGIPQISTGDMLREEREKGTDVGRRSSVFMDRGELVPDELILEMINRRIEKEDCNKGFILDGFPRTLEQAKALDDILKKMGRSIRQVFYFDVPDSELIERLGGRISCVVCGKIYHKKFNPPPSEDKCECGGYLLQRPDDNPEVISQRLEVYRKLTLPLLDYYRGKNKLFEIHGGGKTIEENSRIILKALSGE